MRNLNIGYAVVALAALLTAGCGAEAVTQPTTLAAQATLGEATEATPGYTPPTITLLPDLTVSPSRASVLRGNPVRMVNKSGRGVRVHSGNCSEFSLMGLTPGQSKNTMEFKPAGKVCDYFVWDTNWSRQIFVGQVVVQ